MTKNIMANSMLNAAAGLTMLVAGFISSIVAARMLGPQANGVIAFSFWMSTTATLIAGLGTDVILPRMLPQLRMQGYDTARRRGFGAFLARAVAAAVLILLVIAAAGYHGIEQWRGVSIAPSVLAVTAVLFVCQSLGMLSINFMIGEQRLATFFRLTVVSAVLQVSVLVAGGLIYGTAGALAGYVAGQGVFFIYALRLFAGRADACGASARQLARQSLIISVQIVIESIFLSRIELLFLQQFKNVETVGFYAIGLSLANLALQLPVQLTGTLVPYYTEKLRSRPNGKLPVHLFDGVVRSMAYFTLPMGFGLAAISWEMVVEVFGPPFAPAGTIVALLALSAPISVFIQISTKYLFAIDRERDRLTIFVIGAVLMTAGCLALVPRFGGEGAAAVRIAVLLVMSFLMVRRMDFDGSMRGMFVSLAKIATASLACAVAAYLVAASIDGLAGVVLAIGCGIVIYGVFLRLFGIVPPEDIAMMEPLLDRFPHGLKRPGRHFLALIASRRST